MRLTGGMPAGRSEALFERLAVALGKIAGLPLTEQKILLGRYRHGRRPRQRLACAKR